MRLPSVTPAVLVSLAVLVLLILPSTAHAAPDEDWEEAAIDDDQFDAEDLVGGALVGHGTARSAPGGHAWVSVVGFSMPMPSGRRDVGGFVVLGFPFDRAARVEARTSLAESPRPRALPLSPKPSPPPPPPPPPPAEVAPPPVPAPAPTPSPSPPPPPREPAITITRPIARSCVAAAWRAAGLGSDDERLDAIVSRSRLAGVLPETRLRVIRLEGARLYEDYANPTPTTTARDSTTASLGMEARLTWHLDRLLFASDEPSIERLRLERQDARARVAGHALEALFHWQRAVLELRAADKGSRDETEATLRVVETEAVLDVLTDAWFSRWRSTAP